MKKIIVLILGLMFTFGAEAQTIGANQIKKKTNGGIVADSANNLAVGVYRGTSAPASPVIGMLWLDTNTTSATLKSWNGSAWEIPPTASASVLADLSSFPASPKNGDIVWASSLKRAVIYDEASAAWYFLDSTNRKASTDYSIVNAGYPTDFLGTPGGTTGSVAAGGSVTTGGHVCATTFYNSTGGDTLAGASTSTLTATSGNQTLSLTIPVGPSGTAGRRVWCSKTGTLSPLYYVASVQDNSTTAYSVTVADGSFGAIASPDKDFSGSIPAGWTVYRPSNDPTYGGCGSTGTSLLCYALKFEGASAAASGVRLFYNLTSSPVAWKASLRIVRLVGGFVGSTANIGMYDHPFVVVSSANNVAAPEMRAWGVFRSSTETILPLGALGEPSRCARAVTAVWGSCNNSVVVAAERFNYTWAAPLWVAWDAAYGGGGWGLRPRTSTNGTDWTNHAPYQGVMTEMRHVGIVLERGGQSTGPSTGIVFEIDSFTWNNL